MEPGKRLPGKVAIVTGGASGLERKPRAPSPVMAPAWCCATCKMNWA